MSRSDHISPSSHRAPGRLLTTLERLLALPAIETKGTLDQSTQLVAEVFNADKVDAFLFDPNITSLFAVGASDTPMARKQRSLGLDRLPLANGGRAVEVYNTGKPHINGHTDEDPEELAGIKRGLGVRSQIMVSLKVGEERRGVLAVASDRQEYFKGDDLAFLEAVAHWVGIALHRAELVERIADETAQQARQRTADELIMILAHDLRVPLLPLRGRIAMIRGRAEREGRVRDVHDCDATTRVLDRLQQMIGNLLDAGRLEQGIFTITPQPIDLVALARQAADIIRSQTAEIDLRGPNELHILGDPERLLQILDNLLGNALRYSPEGSPIMIEISTETTLQGIWAVVRVRDQGPGIAPELLPQLFTRFAQGPGSTGLGLGLFLARSAAEAHGGTLGVEPIEGPGTCFRLVLPLTGSTAHE